MSLSHKLAQLDAPNLKQTIQLMGGTNPEQLNNITRWMQNPDQLGKMTGALKETSSADFAAMNSDDFYKRIQSRVEPPIAPVQAKQDVAAALPTEQRSTQMPSTEVIASPAIQPAGGSCRGSHFHIRVTGSGQRAGRSSKGSVCASGTSKRYDV